MSQGSFSLKKNVLRSKGVLCSSFTDRRTDRHESENRWHPCRVSGIFATFSRVFEFEFEFTFWFPPFILFPERYVIDRNDFNDCAIDLRGSLTLDKRKLIIGRDGKYLLNSSRPIYKESFLGGNPQSKATRVSILFNLIINHPDPDFRIQHLNHYIRS